MKFDFLNAGARMLSPSNGIDTFIWEMTVHITVIPSFKHDSVFVVCVNVYIGELGLCVSQLWNLPHFC